MVGMEVSMAARITLTSCEKIIKCAGCLDCEKRREWTRPGFLFFFSLRFHEDKITPTDFTSTRCPEFTITILCILFFFYFICLQRDMKRGEWRLGGGIKRIGSRRRYLMLLALATPVGRRSCLIGSALAYVELRHVKVKWKCLSPSRRSSYAGPALISWLKLKLCQSQTSNLRHVYYRLPKLTFLRSTNITRHYLIGRVE